MRRDSPMRRKTYPHFNGALKNPLSSMLLISTPSQRTRWSQETLGLSKPPRLGNLPRKSHTAPPIDLRMNLDHCLRKTPQKNKTGRSPSYLRKQLQILWASSFLIHRGWRFPGNSRVNRRREAGFLPSWKINWWWTQENNKKPLCFCLQLVSSLAKSLPSPPIITLTRQKQKIWMTEW